MKICSWQFWAGLIILCFLLAVKTGISENPAEKIPSIAESINKGVEWLKSKQLKDGSDKGSWGKAESIRYPGAGGEPLGYTVGIAALVLYALLSCDVPPDDAVIKEGFAFFEPSLKGTPRICNYDRATLLLALEALADARAKKKKYREVGRVLFLLPDEKKLAESLIAFLEKDQSTAGGWRYGTPMSSPGGFNEDISQTQIVLLGLKAASRLGLTVKKATFLKALKFNLGQQEKDGPVMRRVIEKDKYKDKRSGGTEMFREDKARGWRYHTAATEEKEKYVSGAMTTAGICSVVICKSELNGLPEFNQPSQKEAEKSINDGLAWLEKNYSVDKNPGLPFEYGYHYYLYGLERVGMLCNLTVIGSHNWYLDGTQAIIKQQKKEGFWFANDSFPVNGDVIDTSFALLFLKKATKPILSR